MWTFQTPLDTPRLPPVPLETAPFIDGLDPANPAGSDRIFQGDDHIRLIKAALKSTFPNLTGPVTATQDALNAPGFSVPVGIVWMWYGSSDAIPSGWALCDGGDHPKSDLSGTITTPDLRNRSPMGVGATLTTLGATAGSTLVTKTTSAAGGHSHTVTGGDHTHAGSVGGHALTVTEIPAHSHGGKVGGPYGGNYPGNLGFEDGRGTPDWQAIDNATVGGGTAHDHPLTINSATHSHDVGSVGDHQHSVADISVLHPVLGLHFIMKV